MTTRVAAIACAGLIALVSDTRLRAQVSAPIGEAQGLRLMVEPAYTQPALRVLIPGSPDSDRSIQVIFPEHVTVRRHGQLNSEQLYVFGRGSTGPAWRRTKQTLEYERDLPGDVHLLARATLEADGVRFHYEFTNRSAAEYDMAYAVTDPRMTGSFHDERLQRTYVHHANGFDLLASETPERLTLPLAQWLPARYRVSYTWPVPHERVERPGDGIAYYNKSRAVDAPFIATLSTDGAWVVASFSRDPGNVWSNPELTCQHVDPQVPLPAGGTATTEIKIIVLRGTLDDVRLRVARQLDSLR